ncbi:MAG: TAXI family TRAP transporter solute-binding subunit [Desulfobacterales bacterium]|nr:TAXI family TRAP transporter solute-binding subunit [Desulfobacterales bacterium]
MKKKVILGLSVFIVLHMAFMLGGSDFRQARAAGGSDRLIWTTLNPGTSFYFTAVGMTQLINQHTDLKIILRPMPGPVAGIMAIHDGKAQLGELSDFNTRNFTYGIISKMVPAVKKAFPEIRMLMGTNYLWRSWFTRPDTGIKTIYDLKGKKLSYLVPGIFIQNALGEDSLRAAGIDPEKDVTSIKSDNIPGLNQNVKNMKVDGGLNAITGSGIEEVRATRGLVVIPFPPEIYEKLRPELKDAIDLQEIKANYLPGLQATMHLTGFQKYIITNQKLSEETTYTVVKAIMEHAKEIERLGLDFREYGNKQFALPAKFKIPFHDGAIRYYKEAGMWKPEHDARQNKLISELPKK